VNYDDNKFNNCFCFTRDTTVHHLTWADINKCHADEFGNILRLIDLVLTIPASSAECERGFSAMRGIKTDWRNALNCETVSDLMTVLFDTPAVGQYDPMNAIVYWSNSGPRSRRPNASLHGPRVQQQMVNEDELQQVEVLMDDEGQQDDTVDENQQEIMVGNSEDHQMDESHHDSDDDDDHVQNLAVVENEQDDEYSYLMDQDAYVP
jgi:hypothetical protein